MKLERVRQLITALPSRTCYAGADRGAAPIRFQEARDIALSSQAIADPAFGWTLVRAYLDSGKPLPECVTEPELNRAFDYWAHHSGDRDVHMVFELETQVHAWRKAIIKCMLLIKKYSFEQIAGEMCVSKDCIRIYSELFWNVRDRLHDTMYIQGLLYPHTTQTTWARDYMMNENQEMLALRAAHRSGLAAAKQFLGSEYVKYGMEATTNAKRLEAHVMAEALHMADLGLIHQAYVPAIKAGVGMIQSSKMGGEQQQSTDDTIGLGKLGMGTRMVDHFQSFMDNELQHRLQKQRVYGQAPATVKALPEPGGD